MYSNFNKHFFEKKTINNYEVYKGRPLCYVSFPNSLRYVVIIFIINIKMAKLPLCFINDVVKLIIFSVAVTPSLLFFIFCILEKIKSLLES